jgi:hypothetical protein
MTTRREFIEAGFTTLLLVPVGACTSSNSGGSGGCDGSTTTSTVVSGHTHTVCVPTSDFNSPPASGITLTSSTNGAAPHTHTVTLSANALGFVASGRSLTVTSSSSSGHTHDFTITKM